MRRMIAFLVLFGMALPVSAEDIARQVVAQLEHFLENGKLTEGERADLREALALARETARQGMDVQGMSMRARTDIERFKGSPAYSFLSASERKTLQDLHVWLATAHPSRLPTTLEDRAAHAETSRRRIPLPPGLQCGDLVFRREEGFLSHHFVEASSREKRFSHVGVVIACEDGVGILSVEANGASSGVVGEMSWAAFMESAVDGAVYRLGQGEAGMRIAQAAKRRAGISFDPAFDLKTKDRLYCSELVRDAVNEAVGKRVVGTTKRGGFEYVALDDCYRTGWVKVFDAREAK